jgi:hypothetical protein
MGIKLCNKILNKIREMEEMRHFKRELESYLLRHTFYSVVEYVKLKIVYLWRGVVLIVSYLVIWLIVIFVYFMW